MSNVEMHSVTSSAVDAIGYDSEEEAMYVRYSSGKTYAFHGVSFDSYESIKSSDSVGRELRNVGTQGVEV